MNNTPTLSLAGAIACLILALLAAGCGVPAPTTTTVSPDQAMRPATGAAAQLPSASLLPRVMIMIDEQSLGTIATSEVESMAVNKLLEQNIPVVNQDMVRANIARNQQMLQMAGDNRGAASLGTQFGADIVLVGEAVAKPSARRIGDTNLRSYQAVATLRAIRTDNAATLAAASQDATQIGLEDVSGSAKALRAAAEASLNRIIPEILAKWTPGGAGPVIGDALHRLEMTVGGVDQMWKLKAIRESLRGQTVDLQNVVQRSYTSGLAEFSMDSKLPPEELAEHLVLKPPKGLRMQVLEIAAGHIQLKAVEP